ncbi:MAG: succinylglutamate desuccinylase/aspartoacylase family protein [Lewinella sp.]|nr:succinylglutamate desuccinylase/aspartoacylase family protein [Lewinella sp.]
MKAENWLIKDTRIAPGEQTEVKLAVGQLPSGNLIPIRAQIFRAKRPGPTMLVMGGVHGDEINGVEIVRQALAGGLFESLLCGSVIAIPVLNVYGFINFSRDVPDGKDVNRSFPGSSSGSLASRVANTLHKHILPLVDFGLDCHTGGQNNYNYPQIRYTRGDEKAAELAKVFGAPFTIAYTPIRKSLRKVSQSHHAFPMLVFEGGENLRYDGLSIEFGLRGIRRLLVHHGMLAGTKEVVVSEHFAKSRWVRAPKAGLFQWMKPSGHRVRKGEPLGFIHDPYGHKSARYVHAPRDGHIIGHNNTPVVGQGDALFHVAYHEEEE